MAPSDVEEPLYSHMYPHRQDLLAHRVSRALSQCNGTIASSDQTASSQDLCNLCIINGDAELGKLAVLTEQLKIATFPWRQSL